MPCIHVPGGILTIGGDYKPGDPPPTGYLDWHQWAEVQYKAGLRQERCCQCVKVFFPQELSDRIVINTPMNSRGETVVVKSRICKGCDRHDADHGPLCFCAECLPTPAEVQ